MRVYDGAFKPVLLYLWRLLNYSCSKRLVVSLPWLVKRLADQGELVVCCRKHQSERKDLA